MPFSLLRVLMLAMLLPLAACGAKSVYAPEAEVQRAIYRAEGPPSITLFTMINNRSGEGGHAALLINGSQQVLFDPAGSWYNRTVPERNDVLFGMTPLMVQYYRDYHARQTFHLLIQTVQVPPEVAEKALRDVQAYGAVPQAFCSNSVGKILSGLPGFTTISRSMFPARLSRNFGTFPGVSLTTQYDDDPDDNKYLLGVAAAEAAAGVVN